MHSEDVQEVPLQGGNSSRSVVRVGDTVRKPWLPTTERTVDYLVALREHGVDVPEPRGRDERGRLMLDYVPGDVALARGPLDHQLLDRVGGLVRRIHDASAALALSHDLVSWEVLIPTDSPDLLCHHDLAPWNLVIDGDRLVFVDWNGCGPWGSMFVEGHGEHWAAAAAFIARHEQVWRSALA